MSFFLQITGNRDFLVNLNAADDNSSPLTNPQTVRHLLESLAEERNHYALKLLKMAEEMESDEASSTTISSGEHGRNRSPSPSKAARIRQLEEDKANLKKQLNLKIDEMNMAKEAAQDYEYELNDLRHKYSEQNTRLTDTLDLNAQLNEQLRQKADDYIQLEFDVGFSFDFLCLFNSFQCHRLRTADADRQMLLKEKEKWIHVKEDHEVGLAERRFNLTSFLETEERAGFS